MLARAPRCSTSWWSTAEPAASSRRNLVTGEIESLRRPTRWCLATGGYGNVFYLSTNAKGSTPPPSGAPTSAAPASATRVTRRFTPRAFRSRRLPVEADADERVAAQRRARLGAEAQGGRQAARRRSRRTERDYYLERKYPSFGNLAPRDIASRRQGGVRRRAAAWAPAGRASTSTSATPSSASACR